MFNPEYLLKTTLDHFTEHVKGILHPSLFEQVMQQIGVKIGRKLASKSLLSARHSGVLQQEAYSSYLGWLRSSIKWIDPVATNKLASTINIDVPLCPFGDIPEKNPAFCHIEAGILGGVAGDHFGHAKVSICRGAGCPPANCRLTIHLEQTPDSYLAHGPSFPLENENPTHIACSSMEEGILAQLSLRERQTLKLIGEGLSDKEIATALNLSVRTVEGHTARIKDKMGTRSRGNLIRLAIHINKK